LRNREPNETYEKTMVAIEQCLSDPASSDDGEDGEDEDDQTDQGKLSEDDEPSWEISQITKALQQCMERLLQMQMKREKLIQPG
jgi:hypothetical protein